MKLLRRPSPSTNAETTKLTASMTPKVVRAKRILFAMRFLRVSREHGRVPICVSSAIQWVEPAHVVEHGIRGRVGELVGDPTVGEEDDAVRVARGYRVVGDHHDRLAELAHGVTHEREDLGAGRAVEVAGRLVGEDDLRAARQRTRHGDALLLPARQFVRAGARRRFDSPDGLDDVVDPRPVRLAAGEIHRERDVLDRRQRRDEVEGLEDEAEPIAAQAG